VAVKVTDHERAAGHDRLAAARYVGQRALDEDTSEPLSLECGVDLGMREHEAAVGVRFELGESAEDVADPDLIAALAVVALDAGRGVLGRVGCRAGSGLRGHVVPFVADG
jgi:hypothetical protein